MALSLPPEIYHPLALLFQYRSGLSFTPKALDRVLILSLTIRGSIFSSLSFF